MRTALCALALAVAGTAQAVELQLPPTARQMVVRDTPQDRYFAPIGPYVEGVLPTQMIEGAVARSAWRIDVAGLTPLQIITPLRDQLTDAGFDLVLDCAAPQCGGYDFRFATEVFAAPNMYVNIRNYHVLTGLREGEAVSIIASASSGASFVQIIQAGSVARVGAAPLGDAAPQPATVASEGGLPGLGHMVLGGLEFDSGTAQLGAGPFAVIETLVAALRAQPEMRIALVGHTDNIGSLEVNTDLSVSRAEAVRRHLVERYDIAADRLEVQGVGFLSPIASNLTEEGREANRRVEAVVLAE